MQYLMFYEDGEVELKEDIDEKKLRRCCWPTVVRATEIGCGLIRFEKFGHRGEWVILEVT